MKKSYLKTAMLIVIGFVAIPMAYAASPLWSITPLTETTWILSSSDTATVKYQITNHSKKRKTLAMTPIQGVRQLTTEVGDCTNPFILEYQQSCVLNLLITGSLLSDHITEGPKVCLYNQSLQCYQPGQTNVLNIIKRELDDTIEAYTVGGTVFGLQGTVTLQNNGGDALTLNTNGNFSFSNPLFSGNNYAVTVQTQPVGQSCTVTHGSGTIGNANINNVEVRCMTSPTTLSASAADLALSVNNPGLNAALTGTPRQITISNTGNFTADNLTITSPSWPTGTTSATNCGGSLASGGSCTITVTPGSTATSDGANPCSNGTVPVPDVIQVTADNAPDVSVNVLVLSYGCVYQSGFVFAIDDSTPAAGSIGGKAASLVNQSDGIIWSSDGAGGTALDAIPGIDETSTPMAPSPALPVPNPLSFVGCQGANDGACNVGNIFKQYPLINPEDYAAGLCSETIAGLNDWYLPAICEMGYGTNACGNQAMPALQNMQSNLVDNGNVGSLSGYYWSSTEFEANAQLAVWEQLFDTDDNSGQGAANKELITDDEVRCVRALTY